MDLGHLPLYQIDEVQKIEERIYKTKLDGLYYISTEVYTDERGFYREIAVIPDIDKVIGKKFDIKQLNHSRSKKNVIRGIHAEGWNKLVTVASGVCLCVLADLRPNSPTFLQKEYFLLGYGEGNPLPGSIFVTQGIGNSFITIEGPSEYIYAVDAMYRERNKERDVSISLFDPDINIEWPIPQSEMVYSGRDKDGKTLRELYPDKF